MDFINDSKFREISTNINEFTSEILKGIDESWLNKCGHTFIRHAITVNYNQHYYCNGCSWVGGKLVPDKIETGKFGRVCVNMRYILMTVRISNDFLYIPIKDNIEPSFDVFIEY